MEVLATGMPALHQEPDDMVVVGKIRDVLEQRIGTDRFGLWFTDRVRFEMASSALILQVDGEFALERLRGSYLRAVESAAAEVLKRIVPVRLQLAVASDAVLASSAPSPPEQAVVSVAVTEKEAFSATETLARRRPAAENSSSGRSTRRRSGAPSRSAKATTSDKPPTAANTERSAAKGPAVAKVPAAFGDLLISAATDPRHSSGNLPNPRQANPRQASRATTIDPDPSDARSRAASQPARKSIRVMSAAEGDPSQRNRAAAADALPSGTAAASERPREKTQRGEAMTFGTFVTATSNTLATTAAQLLTADPGNAAPLCFWGATGTGKTHLLSAIRHELRTRHRLPRVILLSAEEFTNDFLSCVRGTGLPAFRKRYRDVDALLIDNVQFLGGKSATLREMLYTVDAILSRRRPLVLAGDRQPLEIEGLSGELAGRMSSGLVCGINPMELQLRRELYHRHAQRSFMPWDDATIDALAERTVGDGRVIQGISQLVSMLQRMYRRMPTLQEIMTHAGEMLQRGPKAVALADVERAVCSAFGLSAGELKSDSKSRNVSQPRILAMYLSRQHTTAAFAEIGRYYGDRNHSTVIAAHRRVETWLKDNQPVGGRGPKNMKAKDAIAAVENLLRIG